MNNPLQYSEDIIHIIKKYLAHRDIGWPEEDKLDRAGDVDFHDWLMETFNLCVEQEKQDVLQDLFTYMNLLNVPYRFTKE